MIVRLFKKKTTILIAAAFVFLLGLDLLLPPPIDHARNVSSVALDHEGRWLHAFTTEEGRWRFAAELENIDPTFVDRLISIEDKRFYAHLGMDPVALTRAVADAVSTGTISSGASTITMQTARLLEPRKRTVLSKLIEIVRAVQIERRLSKAEILELYLTLAPYGGNIEGVRAASLSYFGREPDRLSDAEQALLIALPQAPEARRPDRRAAIARAARGTIIGKLAETGHLTPLQADEAQAARLPTSRTRFPTSAYHIARELTHGARGRAGDVITTIDVAIQHEAEILAKAHADLAKDGATAALIIVDHQTMSVRASVGSSGRDVPGGWIDLTNAVRSPGSTLKPLIYALAFEDGLAGPDTVIDDMPRVFGDYSPENFDRTFRGELRIREALQHSLNLPAVAALDGIGTNRFASALKAAGVHLKSSRKPGKSEGLALALGGAGLTSRELAVLYAGLANEGTVKPLQWVRDETENASPQRFQLVSPKNAGRINKILKDAPSLEGRAPSFLSKSAPRAAFKTGTSYGYRDAWAAGHAGRYTVVAWVGRADGASRPGVTGRKAAAPLLFDTFDMLARYENENSRDISDEDEPAFGLARFSPNTKTHPPQIIFPREGVELFITPDRDRAEFTLAARGGAGAYQWYVGGTQIRTNEFNNRSIWRPDRAGFYDIEVVDKFGRSARSKVWVREHG